MRVLLLVFAVSAFTISFAQKDLKKVNKQVSAEETQTHIEFLASDEMRGRDTGSPEIDIAADYIADHFKANGLKAHEGSYFQEVKFIKSVPARASSITADTLQMKHGGDMIVLAGDNGSVQSEVIYAGYGLADDYDGIDVEGKIVLVEFGSEEDQGVNAGFGLRSVKQAEASKHGAVAVLEMFKVVGMPWSRIVSYLDRDALQLDKGDEGGAMPYLWVNDPRNVYLNHFKELGAEVSIEVKGGSRDHIPGKNVFGYVEGTDKSLKDEFLIITAHYDHVGVGRPVDGDSIYNGARDNAIGTVALMNTAKFISKNPARRSVAFLAVTGEEKGLLGSAWYCDNPLIPMEKVIFDFNCDGGGYNDKTMVSVVGLERTTVDETLKAAVEATGLALGGDPAPEQGLYDRSDNVNFSRKGVPSFTFSPGFTAFDQEILKYYHQPGDEPDGLDFEYLHSFNKAFVLSAVRIANMDEAPFWLEGDKYESAGKELYGRD